MHSRYLAYFISSKSLILSVRTQHIVRTHLFCVSYAHRTHQIRPTYAWKNTPYGVIFPAGGFFFQKKYPLCGIFRRKNTPYAGDIWWWWYLFYHQIIICWLFFHHQIIIWWYFYGYYLFFHLIFRWFNNILCLFSSQFGQQTNIICYFLTKWWYILVCFVLVDHYFMFGG